MIPLRKSCWVGWSLLLVLAGVALLSAGELWEEKPYTEWSQDDVERLLADSPWARVQSKTVYDAPIGPPRVGGSLPSHEIQLPGSVVQWASALTLRQAVVRREQLGGRMTDEQAAGLLGMTFQQYVLSVQGPHVVSIIDGFDELRQETLQESAFLRPRGSKRRISPVGIELDLKREPTAWFYFSREVGGKPTLSGEEKVDFVWESAKGRVSVVFDLTKMTRGGKPDL